MPDDKPLRLMRFLGAAADAHDSIEGTLSAMERMLANLPDEARAAEPMLRQSIANFTAMRDAMGGMLTQLGGGQKIPEKRPEEDVH